MGKPAAKMGDKIMATDIHIIMIPTPGGPVPTPLPHPFIGTITTGTSTDVFIEGKPAAVVNSVAFNTPVHIPQGGPFQKPPMNQGKIMIGSTGVFINGKPAARAGDMAMTCNDPVDMPVGQVVAVGTVFIGETGAGAPKPPGQASGGPATATVESGEIGRSGEGGAEAGGAGRSAGTTEEGQLIEAKWGQPGTIIEARWEKDEADCGEEVKMIVDLQDFEDGTPAKFTVWEEDAKGKFDHITEIEGEVQGNKIEVAWKYSMKEKVEGIQKEIEGAEENPVFFFAVEIEGSEAKSQALKLTYLLEIELEVERGEPLDDVDFAITFADGSERTGKIKNGKITVENAPLGKYSLTVDGYEFIMEAQ